MFLRFLSIVEFKMLITLLLMLLVSPLFAESSGTLTGRVLDPQGGVVEGAVIVLTDSEGAAITTSTDSTGFFMVSAEPGIYTLEARARGFSIHQRLVALSSGETAPLDLNLTVAVEQEDVTVISEGASLQLSPEMNIGALILTGDDLDALPEDPDELAEALEALAGPSAGPSGGQIYIDGFTGGRLPPRSSIREIRINQNPFSSEFERIGFGRIEILTRPGTERYRGQASFGFNDAALNSRYPFAPTRAPYQSRNFGAEFGGPVVKGKSSFFVNFDRRAITDNSVVSATILDPQLNIVPFSTTLVSPNTRTSFSPRFDYQLSTNHTFVSRYSFSEGRRDREGVGEFSLPSQAYDVVRRQHEVTLTETAVLGSRAVNELRFRYSSSDNRREAFTQDVGIRVLEAFNAGGAMVDMSSVQQKSWELQDYVSLVRGKHSLRFGGRLRAVTIEDISRSNFSGTFTFSGGLGPLLDDNFQVAADEFNQPVLVPLTSIERYRRTLLFQGLGLPASEIRALGGGASQFSIAGGDPWASVSQYDFGGFLQEDWRVLPNLMISAGLRFETQNNLSRTGDLAPRLAFAWSPGGGTGRRPTTVIRGGYGLFYSRIGESFTLNTRRFDGQSQLQYVVQNPDFFPVVPSVKELQGAARPVTIRQMATDLRPAYSMQSALSLERQLPLNFSISVSYINMRNLHVLRSMNVNAPTNGVRPYPELGNVYEYRSDGLGKQNQLIFGFNNRFSRMFTLFGNYSFGTAHADTDGAGSFPADPFNLRTDWGRAGYDVRHRMVLGGSLTTPGQVRLNPFVIASSGRPFNITSGQDLNGDSIFNERPALSTDLTKPGVIVTRYGAFDPVPDPGVPMIPRNYGQGPGFLMFNMRLSRVFGFGKSAETVEQTDETGGGPPPGGWAGPRGGGPGRGGGGRGMRGGGFGGGSDKPYNLTFSVQATNVLNRTNMGQYIGNLASPLFGTSNQTAAGFGRGGGGFGGSSAGNRRIELQMRFSF
jgi:hypothetical protein